MNDVLKQFGVYTGGRGREGRLWVRANGCTTQPDDKWRVNIVTALVEAINIINTLPSEPTWEDWEKVGDIADLAHLGEYLLPKIHTFCVVTTYGAGFNKGQHVTWSGHRTAELAEEAKERWRAHFPRRDDYINYRVEANWPVSIGKLKTDDWGGPW